MAARQGFGAEESGFGRDGGDYEPLGEGDALEHSVTVVDWAGGAHAGLRWGALTLAAVIVAVLAVRPTACVDNEECKRAREAAWSVLSRRPPARHLTHTHTHVGAQPWLTVVGCSGNRLLVCMAPHP